VARLSLNIVGLPAFKDNYLWSASVGGKAIAVDPGDAAVVINHLAAHELTLAAILTTHHHPDHVGGIEGLLDWRGPVPVYGPARDPIPHLTHPVGEGDRLNLLGTDWHVLDVPGHTAGHIAYYLPADTALFCGDTLFAAGCGRLLGGTAEALYASLMRLAALPADTRVYCAHEYTLANLQFAAAAEPDNPARDARTARESAKRARGAPTIPTTIALERETNPFLRCDQPQVKLAIRRSFSADLPPNAAPALVFSYLREWKNHF
jgi:hydroxyacylglutathione hydrolase